MRKLTFLLILILLFSTAMPTFAQDGSDYQATLDELVQAYVEENSAITVQVTTPDGIWQAAGGEAFPNQPTAIDDRFRIGSMSKTFVSALTLLLVEDGYFSLDDMASDYLSDEVVANLANADEVTLRQLLSMRSGIPDYLETDAFWEAVEATPSYEWTAEEALAYAYDESALFAPDEDFYYSNSNYLLIQLVIESTTGRSYAEVMREYILDPLGLSNTYTQVSERLPGGFVEGYEDFDFDGTSDAVSNINDGAGLADGGLVSTVADITTFYQALLATESLLSNESLNNLYSFLPDDSGEADYGLGLDRWESDYGYVLGHGGAVTGFVSVGRYIPDEDMIIVVLAANENADVEGLADDIMSEFLD